MSSKTWWRQQNGTKGHAGAVRDVYNNLSVAIVNFFETQTRAGFGGDSWVIWIKSLLAHHFAMVCMHMRYEVDHCGEFVVFFLRELAFCRRLEHCLSYCCLLLPQLLKSVCSCNQVGIERWQRRSTYLLCILCLWSGEVFIGQTSSWKVRGPPDPPRS